MSRNDCGIRGLQFIIQSTEKSPGNIEQRVEAFLKMFETKIYEMTIDEFKSIWNLYHLLMPRIEHLDCETIYLWD
ncbi:insulin-degrading enzyme-like 1, peroxisomal [Vigna umbellata]|uniref:insulin-degrading enzyme-like 1, peroxisomal n=1 Tax=Vigna umbellata TaxID=87088 RepID=UPI001F5F0011|nr:insulin-degrading enzyme-like 1, peroxisomal [Vigna umbellata]